MVAKINTSNKLHGTLIYNQQKVDDGEAHVLGVNAMWESPTGEYRLADFAAAFNARLANNNRTEKPIVHISLNPSPKDVLTDEQLHNIGREYMDRMGFGEQPYVIFKHEDIERAHIHIVTTNLKPDGSKISDSNNFRTSKEITNDIERKYNLHPADVKQDNKTWLPEKVALDKGRVRYQIKNITKHLLDHYKFLSINELKAALSLYNVELQEIKGMLNNEAVYKGIIYSATDDTGNRIATPIKSSNIGKNYGITAIEKKIEKSTMALKMFKKEATKQILTACILQSKNQEELKRQLNERGVNIVFRENEAGRIYGATIIDHNAKVVMNGSRLGKEFSANAFHELFEKWKKTKVTSEVEQANTTSKSVGGSQPFDFGEKGKNLSTDNEPTATYAPSAADANNMQPSSSGIGGALAGLIDALFTPVDASAQASAPQEKKKRKKKRKKIL